MEGIGGFSGPAARYAAALYSYASDQDRLRTVSSNMERLGQIIDASADLRRLLESPLTIARDAEHALDAVLKDQQLGMVVRRLLPVLIANRRLNLLRNVISAFASLVAAKHGIVTAYIAVAHDLTEIQQQQLRARLIELGYGSARIESTVDPGLLGGLIVRVGARLYDTSLRSRLQRLQYAMKEAA